ncbi:hypothetical protein [Curtobacterium sp. C2H10]|uniref:hypothetical protein n=1 Tax=Curtobacterium sp. C2H10 TaxID=2736664 RepID=UPI0021C17E7E|nr:hypothetical protein [Curtobacterium sp. C2H10]
MGAVTDRFESLTSFTVDDLGGTTLILGDEELLEDERGALVVAAFCDEWDGLDVDQRKDAARFMLGAAASPNPFLMVDAINVILESREVLPAVHSELALRFSGIARQPGIRAEIALEGWVRLGIGEWARGLPIRAALDERVTALLDDDAEVSPFLLRALGAAIDTWEDGDLLQSLQRLANRDDADAAVELGFRSLRDAVSAANVAAASTALSEAIAWFNTALSWEERPDARAFGTAAQLLQSFANGARITQAAVAQLHGEVYEYLTGFIGTIPTWRRPRAETVSRWLILITDLESLRELGDDTWLNAGAVIAAAGRVLVSSRTIRVIARAAPSGDSADNEGLLALVHPRLVTGFSAIADITRQLDKWLTDTADPELAAELRSFRDVLRGDAPPKQSEGTASSNLLSLVPQKVQDVFGLTGASYEQVNAAANDHPAVVPVLEMLAQKHANLTVTESEYVDVILQEVDTIVPLKADVRVALYPIATTLVRFVSNFLNVNQSGETRAKWLGPSGRSELEATFSNELRNWMRSSGLQAMREVPDIAGGRSDIILISEGQQFVIESKRVTTPHTFDQLATKYGSQAIQYQVSNAPIGLLAVVDYGRRDARTDLSGSFNVRPYELSESKRRYALVTARVLANVATPSASSK